MRSQFSNAILSVYGLTHGEVLVSVTEFKARFTGILPSSQDYAIRVITLAGDELDYSLDVQLQRRTSTIPPLSSPTSPPPDTPTATPEVIALATSTQPRPVSGVQPPPEGGLFVYLTFDDGPGAPFTGQVLDLLARFNAKGTFFVLGVNVQTMPEFTRRAALEGHAIANHTMSHTSLQGIDHEAFFNEVSSSSVNSR